MNYKKYQGKIKNKNSYTTFDNFIDKIEEGNIRKDIHFTKDQKNLFSRFLYGELLSPTKPITNQPFFDKKVIISPLDKKYS